MKKEAETRNERVKVLGLSLNHGWCQRKASMEAAKKQQAVQPRSELLDQSCLSF